MGSRFEPANGRLARAVGLKRLRCRGIKRFQTAAGFKAIGVNFKRAEGSSRAKHAVMWQLALCLHFGFFGKF